MREVPGSRPSSVSPPSVRQQTDYPAGRDRVQGDEADAAREGGGVKAGTRKRTPGPGPVNCGYRYR